MKCMAIMETNKLAVTLMSYAEYQIFSTVSTQLYSTRLFVHRTNTTNDSKANTIVVFSNTE